MKDCMMVRDLLPLYVEDLASEESRAFVEAHLRACPVCREELAREQQGGEAPLPEPSPEETIKPLQRILRRLRRGTELLSYGLLAFFILFGYSLTDGGDLFYNSILMPAVGAFGYGIFGLRGLYKLPLFLLVLDLVALLLGLVQVDLLSLVLWTGLYSLFVFLGYLVAWLLHIAFGKEIRL